MITSFITSQNSRKKKPWTRMIGWYHQEPPLISWQFSYQMAFIQVKTKMAFLGATWVNFFWKKLGWEAILVSLRKGQPIHCPSQINHSQRNFIWGALVGLPYKTEGNVLVGRKLMFLEEVGTIMVPNPFWRAFL